METGISYGWIGLLAWFRLSLVQAYVVQEGEIFAFGNVAQDSLASVRAS